MLPVRALLAAAILATSVASLTSGAMAQATTPPGQEKATGLWLMTDYPELTQPVGSEAKIALELKNAGLPPERIDFGVDGLPDGWKWQLMGGSEEIGAAMVGPDETRDLTLTVTPPKDAKTQTVSFNVVGHGANQSLSLPIKLTLAAPKPAKLDLEADLPALRGSPSSSFDFQVSITNDSPDDATVNLLAQAPDGFNTVFKEQYGQQELTSLPIKAGEKKSVKLSVTPPHDVAAGEYPILFRAASPAVKAETQLVMQVTGQPRLTLSGPNGRLSGEATAGKAETFTFDLTNDGSAPAENVQVSASAPQGWKVTFNPDKLASIAPNEHQSVQAELTPSEKAITGDYMVNIRAGGKGASDSAQFRVTVITSTGWGVAGLGIIGAAVLVLAVSVARYGRR